MTSELSLLLFAMQFAGFMLSTVAAVVFYFQRQLSPVFGMSFWLCISISVAMVSSMVGFFTPGLPDGTRHMIFMLSYAACFFIAPLILFQVRLLTGQQATLWPRVAFRHLILPGFALFCVVLLAFISPEHRQVNFGVEGAPDVPLVAKAVTGAIVLLAPVFYAQLLIYAGLLLLELRQHRARLRQVFASTESREMYWAFGIAFAMSIYAAQALVQLTFGVLAWSASFSIVLDRAAVLFAIVVLVTWGLRQAPGLYQQQLTEMKESEELREKYSRSALEDQHAQRIARKLRNAMEAEQLYRDPNLSLTRLSQHIGSSPNYVSQTLNEYVEQSFFDFVNIWRISEAKNLIVGGHCTVLEIAYEVGFNSRSAFYSAFKKHVGQTPSQYKASALNTKHAPASVTAA